MRSFGAGASSVSGRMALAWRLAIALAASGVIVAACGPTTSSGSGRIETSPSTAVLPTTSAAVSVSPSGAATSPSAMGSAGAVRVDASLLSVLPTTVGGVALSEDHDTAAEIAADPALAATIAALDVGAAFGATPSGDTPADYAVATVVRLRDGVYSESFFRDWRDTFERGVCERAGGVSPGASEFELAGRTVYRATCAGGVVMYQTYLEGPGVLVSIQGAGPADLGRAIAGSLKE